MVGNVDSGDVAVVAALMYCCVKYSGGIVVSLRTTPQMKLFVEPVCGIELLETHLPT